MIVKFIEELDSCFCRNDKQAVIPVKTGIQTFPSPLVPACRQTGERVRGKIFSKFVLRYNEI
jgi:hypothetical protein